WLRLAAEGGEYVCAVGSIRRIRGEQPHTQRTQILGDRLTVHAGVGWFARELRVEDVAYRTDVRSPAGQRLEQHHADRVPVDGARDRLRARLLGWDVARRTHELGFEALVR